MQILKAGDVAPQFSLPNQDNQKISLGAFAGKKWWFYFIFKPRIPYVTILALGFGEGKLYLAALKA